MKKGLSDARKSLDFGAVRNRKAISDVITAVLLILIAIIAILLLWYVLKKQIGVDADLSGITVDAQIKGVSLDNSEARVIVERNTGRGNVSGFVFRFVNSETSYSEQKNVTLRELETATFFINLTGKISNVQKVLIAPILITEKGRRVVGYNVDEFNFSCTSSCSGKECGSDGCYGSCGSCSTGKICEVGSCINIPTVNINMMNYAQVINVQKFHIFNVTLNISCSNENCGQIKVSLDPYLAESSGNYMSGNVYKLDLADYNSGFLKIFDSALMGGSNYGIPGMAELNGKLYFVRNTGLGGGSHDWVEIYSYDGTNVVKVWTSPENSFYDFISTRNTICVLHRGDASYNYLTCTNDGTNWNAVWNMYPSYTPEIKSDREKFYMTHPDYYYGNNYGVSESLDGATWSHFITDTNIWDAIVSVTGENVYSDTSKRLSSVVLSSGNSLKLGVRAYYFGNYKSFMFDRNLNLICNLNDWQIDEIGSAGSNIIAKLSRQSYVWNEEWGYWEENYETKYIGRNCAEIDKNSLVPWTITDGYEACGKFFFYGTNLGQQQIIYYTNNKLYSTNVFANAEGTNNILLGIFGSGLCVVESNCEDGVDNDLDGLADSEDPDCILTQAKSGLIPKNAGNPFFTYQDNPYTISLNKDQSQVVTFFINATGTAGLYTDFFSFANLSLHQELNAHTNKFNVTISN